MKILLPVKPFQETLYGGFCGPASLKMVLSYYGTDISEAELAQRCNHTPDVGATVESMKEAAESYGFKAEIHNHSSLQDIEQWLLKKVPVIVNWFTPGRPGQSSGEMPDGHSSVVVGLDDEYMYLQDPELGDMRTIKRSDFLRVWFDFKGNQITTWDDIILRQLIAVYR